MTTKVTIDAHAGWPVKVEEFDPVTSEELHASTVEPDTVKDFYVHDGCALIITEMRIKT